MKPYRVKHKPIGLYYQPAKGGNNLSECGKVYLTSNNPLSMDRGCDYIWIDLKVNSRLYQKHKDSLPELEECRYDGSKMSGRVPKDKFEVEYLK